MAYTIKQTEVLEKYKKSCVYGNKWTSFSEFETSYLRRISETQIGRIYYEQKGGETKIEPIDHHPDLMKYEIWSEGYCATGESSTAQLLGVVEARNFGQACHILMCRRYLEQAEKENHPQNSKYCNPGRWDYDPQGLTYWGCRLFWSEKLARMSFG